MMSPILDIKEEKVVTVERSVKINEDFAKELAISLLKGEGRIISWEYEHGGYSSTQTVELLLPDGVRLTIERESY